MILTKKVEITINFFYYKHLTNLGYKNLNYKEKIKIPIKHLPKNSTAKIKAKCDVCKTVVYKKYINYLQSKENYNFFSCCKKCSKSKKEMTNMRRYGVKTPAENKNIFKKIQNTNFKKYGTKTPMESEELKKRFNDSMLKKHGCKWSMQNKQLKENFNNSIQKKYGCDWALQNKKSFEKQQKSGFKTKTHKETGLKYRGTYEKDFLDYCVEKKIKITNGPTIKYFFEGKTRFYFSDFYHKESNLIIEIKSDYIYKKYLKKNTAKRKSSLKNGYNYTFIINKNYKSIDKKIKTKCIY